MALKSRDSVLGLESGEVVVLEGHPPLPERGRGGLHIIDPKLGRILKSRDSESDPYVALEAAPKVFAELLGGYVSIDSAVASGLVKVDGPQREARRFFEIFRLPSREQAAK